MRTKIGALKEAFKAQGTLLDQVSALSTTVTEVGDTYLFSPKTGKLFDLLNLLRQHGVVYTTNFNVDDESFK